MLYTSVLMPLHTPPGQYVLLCLSKKMYHHVSVSKTENVSQSDCCVTHWAVEMRFLHWWSSFDTVFWT